MTAAWYYRRPGDALPEGVSPKPPKSPEEKAADQQRALEIWRDARPIFRTPAEWYLRERGLMPDRLLYPDSGDGWPETLRWSDDLTRKPTPPHYKGLVCAVNDAATTGPVGIHRIPLHGDGRPCYRSDGHKLKLSLGNVWNNAWRGTMYPDPHGRWGIAEGVESAMAATQLFRFPVWAAISAGNMAEIKPPSWARHATIFADHDAPNRLGEQPGIDAAADALAAFRAMNFPASVFLADSIGDDIGDILRKIPYET